LKNRQSAITFDDSHRAYPFVRARSFRKHPDRFSGSSTSNSSSPDNPLQQKPNSHLLGALTKAERK
jgi:hypothetical protein